MKRNKDMLLWPDDIKSQVEKAKQRNRKVIPFQPDLNELITLRELDNHRKRRPGGLHLGIKKSSPFCAMKNITDISRPDWFDQIIFSSQLERFINIFGLAEAE